MIEDTEQITINYANAFETFNIELARARSDGLKIEVLAIGGITNFFVYDRIRKLRDLAYGAKAMAMDYINRTGDETGMSILERFIIDSEAVLNEARMRDPSIQHPPKGNGELYL